jgi:hypothetical protein
MSRTNSDFEGIAGLYGVDAAPCQHAPVKERVTGPIGEFDKAKPFLGAEPFDPPVDWRAGRCFEPRLCEPGPGSESARLWVVVIGVKAATPRMAEILRSHFGSWRRDPDDSCSVTGSAEVLV